MYLEKMGFLQDFRVEFIIKLAKIMINLLLILQKQKLGPECKNEAKKEHNKGKRGRNEQMQNFRDQIAPEDRFQKIQGGKMSLNKEEGPEKLTVGT